MGNVCGTVVQRSPSTFSWLFEYEKLPNVCTSEKLYVCGNKYEVSFRLENYFWNKSYLFLHVFKTFALKVDLHIITRYKDGRTTDYSLEDIACYSIGPCRLANVEISDLIEVRCTFSNIRESTISGWIKVREDNNERPERCYRSINYENEKIEAAIKETIKSKGKIKNNDELERSFKHESVNTSANITESIETKGKKVNSYEQDKWDKKIKYDYAKINPEIKEPIKSKSLAESLEEAFLNDEDSDVIFQVGDQTYPAHKVIIKCRSPVFRAMLKHDMKEKNEGAITIPDCDPHTFTDFLFFLYTGTSDNLSKENVFKLYQMSDKYDVKDLRKVCVDFMLQNLSVGIICDIITLATIYGERSLLTRATQFFIDHAKDILTTVHWQKFVKEYPAEANELFLKTLNKRAGELPFSTEHPKEAIELF